MDQYGRGGLFRLQERRGFSQASARVEQAVALVGHGYFYPEIVFREKINDLLAEVMHVHHGVVEACGFQAA